MNKAGNESWPQNSPLAGLGKGDMCHDEGEAFGKLGDREYPYCLRCWPPDLPKPVTLVCWVCKNEKVRVVGVSAFGIEYCEDCAYWVGVSLQTGFHAGDTVFNFTGRPAPFTLDSIEHRRDPDGRYEAYFGRWQPQ